mmetsp:Transcript_11960/g.23861  ORF Transcript_11960/g.23861 Transcript_11960/m.23861 type:complete len:91 (+) Transcript_11960:164-436(+)
MCIGFTCVYIQIRTFQPLTKSTSKLTKGMRGEAGVPTPHAEARFGYALKFYDKCVLEGCRKLFNKRGTRQWALSMALGIVSIASVELVYK